MVLHGAAPITAPVKRRMIAWWGPVLVEYWGGTESGVITAIGAGAWLSRTLFGQHALDLQVPLLSFLFLVALGIDYTIFLVHRAKTEAVEHGTRQGMVRAITSTGNQAGSS